MVIINQILVGRYISLTPSPWTTPMDPVHGPLEWTTHGPPQTDHPETRGKHKVNKARTQTKDAINRQALYGTPTI